MLDLSRQLGMTLELLFELAHDERSAPGGAPLRGQNVGVDVISNVEDLLSWAVEESHEPFAVPAPKDAPPTRYRELAANLAPLVELDEATLATEEFGLLGFDDHQVEQLAPASEPRQGTVEQVGAQPVGIGPIRVGQEDQSAISQGETGQSESELFAPRHETRQIGGDLGLERAVGVDRVDRQAHVVEERRRRALAQDPGPAALELDQ